MDFLEDNTKDNGLQRPPRPAATIILIRDYHKRLQAYLLKRNNKSRFFPGSYVFPGGVLEEDDRDLGFWRDHIDMDREEVSRRFGGINIAGEDTLAYCVAGIRETFEEAGVFIARNGSIPLLEQAGSIRIRDGLQNLWFRNLISSSGWILDLASLSRWSHWVTPKLMKYHFDTRYFVATMPPGQSCLPDSRETEEGIWITPENALEANLKGTIPLSPPTIVTMHELLDYPDVDSLKRAWETRLWGDARYPRMIQSKDGPVILEPWDPQYNDLNENMDTTAFGSLVLSSAEPFSRLYLHNGIWKPVRVE
jgi:8-oxo-dGTP pyrophosphatase MutT (NUDIX family)